MRRVGLGLLLLLLPSLAAAAVPSPTADRSGTPTPTGTPALPRPDATVGPDVAGFGQRVELRAVLTTPATVHWLQVDGDAAIEIEHADAAVASFVVPAVDAPTTVRIRLTLTTHASVSAYFDVTLLPPGTIALETIGGSAPPGARALVSMRLRSAGHALGTIQHDVYLAPTIAARMRPDGFPDCTVGEGLAVRESLFLLAPVDCGTGSCERILAYLLLAAPPSDGSELFRCHVDLPNGDVGTCAHTVACGLSAAADGDGGPLAVHCEAGTVVADQATMPRPITVHVTPAHPAVGEWVSITASSREGESAVYELIGADDLLSGPRSVRGDRTHSVTFSMTATQPGDGEIQVRRHDEVTGGCPGRTYYVFQSDASPPIPLTVVGLPHCPGDCRNDGMVDISDIVAIVAVAVGAQPIDTCPLADLDGDGAVGIVDAVRAVLNALDAC